MALPAQPAIRTSQPTASLAVQAHLAASFYSSQALLAAWAIRDILAIWNQLNLRDVRSSWPAIRVALESLIETGPACPPRRRSRTTSGPAGSGSDRPCPRRGVPPPSPRLMQATLDSTGPYSLLGRIKQAQPLGQAMANTSVVMSGRRRG